jgi:hypothetical protein
MTFNDLALRGRVDVIFQDFCKKFRDGYDFNNVIRKFDKKPRPDGMERFWFTVDGITITFFYGAGAGHAFEAPASLDVLFDSISGITENSLHSDLWNRTSSEIAFEIACDVNWHNQEPASEEGASFAFGA